MTYMRLSSHDGVSRFEELDVAYSPQDFAPPAPPLDLTAPMAADAVMVILSAGDVLLAEDTTGPGHGSRCLDDSLVAIVRR